MNLEYDFNELSLRVLDENYAELVLKFYEDNMDLFQKFEIDKPYNFCTLDFQKKLLASEFQNFIHGNYIRFYLFHKNNPNKIIGTISFSDMKRSAFFSCQIGYKIDSHNLSQGYGFKMLAQAINILENECNMHRFEAFILPDNLPSINLVKKVGFEFEGIAKSYVFLHGKWTDHLRYAYISNKLQLL